MRARAAEDGLAAADVGAVTEEEVTRPWTSLDAQSEIQCRWWWRHTVAQLYRTT